MAADLTEAAAQLRRLLLALPALESGKAHSIEEIAAKVGASVETVARDLRTLVTRTGDEPGGFFERIQLGFDANRVQLRSNVLKAPMALSPSELRAIELGLDVLSKELPPEEAALADRARERVRQAAVVFQGTGQHATAANDAASSGRAVTLAMGDEPPVYLSTIRAAISKRCKAKVRYRSADAAEESERVVRPYGLIFAGGNWFLVAFCEMRNGMRVFRMDRCAHVEVLEDAALEIPDGFSLDDVLRDGRAFASAAVETLTVRYGPAIARWIQENEQGEACVDGSFIVEHPLLDDRWAVRHVLQYGAEAEVIAPARIRSAVAAKLRGIAHGHSSPAANTTA
jgi:predicted DNA-binding transcriptional regulator YafY